MLNLPLFYNHNFLSGGNGIFIKHLYDRGIRFVGDIMIDFVSFVTLPYLETIVGCKINFLQYEILKRRVKCFISSNNMNLNTFYYNVQPCINTFLTPVILKNNRDIYDIKKYTYNIFNAKFAEKPTCQTKWNTFFSLNELDWEYIYSLPFKYSKDSYLQWFQTRIVHRILGTNSLLYKMNIKNDNLCTFCKMEEETLIHLFWNCYKIQDLLNKIKDICTNANISINCFKKEFFILGSYNSKSKNVAYDILFLEIKKYIYLCKRKEITPTVIGVKKSLSLAWEIYKNAHITDKDNQNWSIVRSFINY